MKKILSKFIAEPSPILHQYDFIIVGAGPAGSFAGRNLSKKGFKVLIVDAQKEFKRKVCGEYLCPRGVELLIKNDLKNVVDQYDKLFGMKIVTPQYKILRTKFPKGTCLVDYGISVNRETFDRTLLEEALKAGAEYLSDFRVSEIKKERDILTIKDVTGRSITTKILVGADGRHSFVSKHLKAHKKEQGDKLSIHAILKLSSKLDRFGEMHLLDKGIYIGLNPINEFEVNISIMCSKHQYSSKEKPLDFLLRYMRDHSILYTMAQNIVSVVDVHTVFPIAHHVSKYKPKNIVLIGDAAGFVDPLTGEGMYNALVGGRNLARVFYSIEDLKGSATIQEKLNQFYLANKKALHQKTLLNQTFQKVIKNKKVISLLYSYLNGSQERADNFIGIIGNTYNPLHGLKKLIFKRLSIS